jgi:hypothetical protein
VERLTFGAILGFAVGIIDVLLMLPAHSPSGRCLLDKQEGLIIVPEQLGQSRRRMDEAHLQDDRDHIERKMARARLLEH